MQNKKLKFCSHQIENLRNKTITLKQASSIRQYEFLKIGSINRRKMRNASLGQMPCFTSFTSDFQSETHQNSNNCEQIAIIQKQQRSPQHSNTNFKRKSVIFFKAYMMNNIKKRSCILNEDQLSISKKIISTQKPKQQPMKKGINFRVKSANSTIEVNQSQNSRRSYRKCQSEHKKSDSQTFRFVGLEKRVPKFNFNFNFNLMNTNKLGKVNMCVHNPRVKIVKIGKAIERLRVIDGQICPWSTVPDLKYSQF